MRNIFAAFAITVFSSVAIAGTSPTLVDNFYIGSSLKVGGGEGVANRYSVMDLNSTTKGMLIPRMTTTQRDAISEPPEGLLIFNVTTERPNYYSADAVAWQELSESESQWTTSGDDIYFGSGNVGIGTDSPAVPLHVIGDSYFSYGSDHAMLQIDPQTAAVTLTTVSDTGSLSLAIKTSNGDSSADLNVSSGTATLDGGSSGAVNVFSGNKTGGGTKGPVRFSSGNSTDDSFQASPGEVDLTAGAGSGFATVTAKHLSLIGAQIDTVAYSDGPAITGCGTSPSVAGSDFAGQITVGSGGTDTSCTLTFEFAYAHAPACMVNYEGAIIAINAVPSTSAVVISKTAAFAAGSKIDYICVGH